MKKSICASILAVIVLTGCNLFPNEDTKTDAIGTLNKNSSNPVLVNQGLPVQKLVVTNADENQVEFLVEVASTDSQRKVGLMNRTSMDDDKGMLFVFDKSGIVNFWMKNTLIPLDMVFINEKGIIESITHNAQPCKQTPCPLYNSYKSVRYVLELNAGVTERENIKEGNKATWL